MQKSIIAISYAKRALDPGSRERDRMKLYAEQFETYHLIVFTRKSEGFPSVQQDGDLTLYATNSRSKLGMVARAFKIGKKIMTKNPEMSYIVSSQDPFETSFIGRMLTFQNQHTHHMQIHGDVFNPFSYRGSLLQWLRVQYAKRIVKKTKKIRVVSQRIRESLLQLGVASSCIVVLPIQADLKPFFAFGEKRPAQRGNTLSLLYVGRLAPEKNLQLVLTACALFKNNYGGTFSLRIVGSGPEKIRLQQMVIDVGVQEEVAFVDWSESIAEEMSKSDVLCLSSDHEGFAMVLQEAAASRMTIVTTDVGCASDLLTHQQEALVVPVGDQITYANCLQQLQDEQLRNQLADAAYEKVRSQAITQEEYLRQFVASHK